MANLFFNDQQFLNNHASTDEVITEYSRVWSTEDTIDWPTEASRSTSDITSDSWVPHENSLGLSGVFGPELVWSAQQLACPAATGILNRTDTQFFSTSFLHQPSLPDSMVQFWQPSPPHHLSLHEGATLDRLGESHIPHSDRTIPLPECHLTRKPTTRSPIQRVSPSRLVTRSVSPRSRRTPYSLGPDITRRGDISPCAYQCQWFNGTRPCGAIVAGTKSAIAQHLQTVHAIRLKSDRTVVCHWDKCQKPMRGESISRHVLSVHMRDKVSCPDCGSGFARADSMQRHQKTCLAKGEHASDACKLGG